MPKIITEAEVEKYILGILSNSGYQILFGPDISPDGLLKERQNYSQVLLIDRLFASLSKINPAISQKEKEEVLNRLKRFNSNNLISNNKDFHKYLTDGIDIEKKDSFNRIVGSKNWLFDFENIDNNEFLAVNQFSIIENNNSRRADIIIFINGLPLIVFELKNPLDVSLSIKTSFNQFKTYINELPSLFGYNEMLVITDGIEARAGTLSSNFERFMPWKSVDGLSFSNSTQLDTLLKGIFNKKTILDLLRNFILFEDSDGKLIKKLAAYHQYYAVNKALDKTIISSSKNGDGRSGVIWHTQGSGKSLTMVFYASKLVNALNNPTIVVLTDRNDLDDQLFNTFSSCSDILRQDPVQATSREELKILLKVASGGIIFTTIQKFFPETVGDRYPLLSDRKNIVVIADEAHRSQYDFIDGFARHLRDGLPNASYIGFTGTPIEKEDRSTPEIFGNYIDIYDIERAIDDGSTVPIYYESRLAKLNLNEGEIPKVDPKFEEVTENEEEEVKHKLKSKWARLEAIVGTDKRIKSVAAEIVYHFEQRQKVLNSKAIIVCMSRRICVELYSQIIKLKPNWHSDNLNEGMLKVIMTGQASDPLSYQEHIHPREIRRKLAARFRDPNDEFKLAIVRDMWLTGFDVPCLATMYIDKPMSGHNLMQAIARVNRVYKDKPGGLIVDYIGIADDLKKAVSDYTSSGGIGSPVIDKEEAISVMLEKYEILKGIFYGFDYEAVFTASYDKKLEIITSAVDFIVENEDKKDRFLKYVLEISKAYSLAVPHPKALSLSNDISFFESVKSRIKIITRPPIERVEDLDLAIKQIVSEAVSSTEVVDIFSAAGLKRPDISILSDEFLFELEKSKNRNLSIELLKRLINDEIKLKARKNLVVSKLFSEMLKEAILKYHNNIIDSAKIINELIELAKELRDSYRRGDELGRSEDELAFYDALEVNDSAVKILGDDVLKQIAKDLVKTVKSNLSIDWNLRENVKANLRRLVRRTLKRYNYPPDKQQKAVETVLEQTELLCEDWGES